MANAFDRSPLGALADEMEQAQAQMPLALPAAPQMAPVPAAPSARSTGLTGERAPSVSRKSGKIVPPQPFAALFQQAAQRHGVPINVLIGLADQESGFDPRAVGTPTQWGRAKGMLQYLDDTAKNLGINPFDPAQAIDAAAKQLSERLKSGYTMEDAIKEHFAGPDRKKWGKKTEAYGREVLDRVGRVDVESMFAAPPARAEAAATADPETDTTGRFIKLDGEMKADDPSFFDQIGRAISTATGRGGSDNRPLIARLDDAAGQVVDAVVPNAIQRGLRRGDQGALAATGGMMPESVYGKAADNAAVAANIADLERRAERYPQDAERAAALGRISDSKTYSGAAIEAAKNPGALVDVILESLGVAAPQLAATGIASTLGGPLATAGASGTGSFATEYGQTILEAVQGAAGGDLTDVASVTAAFGNEKLMEKARDRAVKRGVPIALFDAATAGVAGQLVKRARGLLQGVAAAGGEAAVQALGGMGGEAAAQISADGSITKPGEVLLEGLAEIPMAAVEVPGNVAHARRNARIDAPSGIVEEAIPGEVAASAQQNPVEQQPSPVEQAPVAAINPLTGSPAGPLQRAAQRLADAQPEIDAGAAQIAGQQRAVFEIPGEGVSETGVIVQQDVNGTLFRTDSGQEFMVPADDPEATVRAVSEAEQVEAEPAADTLAQVEAIRDPQSAKDTALITPNSARDLPDGALDGLEAIETNQGLLITSNPEKAAAVTATGGEISTDQVGDLLGYTTPKGENDGTVVQALDAGGNVVHEEATNAANLASAAARARDMAPEGGEVQVTDAVQALDRRAQAVGAESVAQPAAVAAPAREIADYSEPELRERLRFVRQQAKANGWNKALSTERRNVEAEIDRRAAASGTKEQASADDGVRQGQPDADVSARSTGARAQAGVGESAGSAEDARGAARGRSRAEKPVAAVPDDVAGAGPTGDAQPAVADAHAGKWFGSADKAEAYLSKKNIVGSHAVTQTGRARFEIKPRATNAEVAAKAGNARGGAVRDALAAMAAGKHPELALQGLSQDDARSVAVAMGQRPKAGASVASMAERMGQEARSDWTAAAKKASTQEPVAAPRAAAPEADALAGARERWTRTSGSEREAVLTRAGASKLLVNRAFDKMTKGVQQRVAAAFDSEGVAPQQTAEQIQPPPAGNEDLSVQPTNAEYGASNTLVSRARADELRARLRAKLGQVSSGIDPEILALGAELAAFHIEAGARKFAAFANAIATDLGTTTASLRPYLRAWYNSARDLTEDAGLDVSDMNTPDEVRAELAAIVATSQGETNATDQRVRAESGDAAAQPDQGDPEAGAEGPRAEGAAADAGQRPAGEVPGSADADGRGDAERRSEPDPVGSQRDQRPAEGGAAGERDARGGNGSGAGTGDRGNRRPDRVAAGSGSGRRAQSVRSNQPVSAPVDYRIQPGEIARQGSWKATAERNVDVVELVKRLEAEGRQPTADERALMTRFTGWGASEIANGVFPDRYGRYKDGWQSLGERLKAAMSPEEYETARRSTQYAHYTSEGIIRSIYSGLERLGFAGGAVLEPGMGIGLFKGLMPESMASSSNYTGIEYDKLTGAIAKYLYPASNVVVGDYTRTNLPRDFFDAAIGNPPFSQTRITNDPEYKKAGFLLHDYFFAKTIDRVKPGGVMVFVTSKGTMDKASDRARKYLSDRANLLGAVRLPQTAFKDNAGTDVVTDVLFLQKRSDTIPDNGVAWAGLEGVETPTGTVQVNEYFAANPQMVLGNHATTSSAYRSNEYTVTPRAGQDIEQAFTEALQNLPEAVYRPGSSSRAAVAAARDRDFNPTHKKEGGLYLADDGRLMQVEQGAGVEVTSRQGSTGKPIQLTDKGTAWLKGWVSLRNALKQAQLDQLTDGNWEASLAELNTQYAKFVKKNGNILAFTDIKRTGKDGEETVSRRFKNEPLFLMDVEGALAYAMEKVHEDGTITKGAILNGRVLRKPAEPVIQNTQDALFVQLNQDGRLDIDAVAKMAGTDRDKVIEELGTAIYDAPGSGWTTADDYLSGNVVRKLAEARQAAKGDRKLQRNVDALMAIQPRPLAPSEITVRLGANWVPPTDIEGFAKEILGNRMDVSYSERLGQWSVASVERLASEYGTARMGPADILDAVLNNRQITVRDKVSDGTMVVNAQETEAANDRARRMKEAFGRWLWTDAGRADRLTGYYNEHFNNIVPRTFDGSHLTLPGISMRFEMRPHQKRAVWRNIQQGDTYYAHAVGAGKTFTAIASGMEQKRLGLISKPIYTVPNHMLAQFSREFLELYPTANIMVADEQNFHTGNRRRFIAQAALNDPDAIIMTHSSFGRLGMSAEYQKSYIESQIEEWRDSLDDVESNDRITKKGIEQRIEQMERRLESRMDESRKDQVMTFEELGADYLYVDEAHEFRKLDFATNQARIKGIDPTGSQRSADLHMKVEYLRSKKPGRALTMMSGTPVTNTMGELFTVQRFFQPQQLEEDGTAMFDAWAAQYGDIVTGLEQNAAGGYQQVSRFAKFQNVPELMHRVRSFMDILTSEQLGELVERPTVRGGQREIVVVPAQPGYRQYQKTLEERIAAIKGRSGRPEKGADIILKVIADGRFSAIDMRFVNPSYEVSPDAPSKLDQVIDQMVEDYRASSSWEYSTDGRVDERKGGTLMMFTDIGLGEQSAETRGFDMKGWIEQRLVSAGIPREEIAFMRDHKQHAKKEKLFSDMREGRKRILIGGKDMETGVNVQKRLAFLSHLDAPWFPASVEQREGRIERQGNQNGEVTIRAFATKGSYDSTMWGMNARKQRFIDQAMSGDDSVRSMEDVSESSAFEMAAALASGDERYLKLAGLRGDAERLTRLANAHHDEQRNLRRQRESDQSNIKADAKRIEELKAVISQREEIKPGEFSATVGEASFDNRDEFSAALYDDFKARTAVASESTAVIGRLGGFDIKFIGHQARDGSYSADVVMNLPGDPLPLVSYPIEKGFAINGMATRAANQVSRMDRDIADLTERMERASRRLQTVESRIGAPFPDQAELLDKQVQLTELEIELAREQPQAATDAKEPAVDPVDGWSSVGGEGNPVVQALRRSEAIGGTDGARNLMQSLADSESLDEDYRVIAGKLAPMMEDLGVRLVPAPAGAPQNYGGAYVPSQNAVWIRSPTAETILHEGLHAVTSNITRFPSARKNETVRRAVSELEMLRETVAAHLRENPGAGGPILSRLMSLPTGPLSNIQELLAYGMTQRRFQVFLDSIPAPADRQRARSVWTAFKDAIASVFAWRMTSKQRSVLDALIENTGELVDFQASQPVVGRMANQAAAVRERSALDLSVDPDEGGINLSDLDLDHKPLNEVVGGALTTLKKSAWLPMTPLNYLVDYARAGMVAVRQYIDVKREMDAYRGEKHATYDKHAQEWLAWASKNVAESGELSSVMHDSTIAQVDPSKEYRKGYTLEMEEAAQRMKKDDPERARIEKKIKDEPRRRENYAALVDRYQKLSPQAKDLYSSTRDLYKAQSEELDGIIEANISAQLDAARDLAKTRHTEEMERIKDDGLDDQARAKAEDRANQRLKEATAGHRYRKGARILRLRQILEGNRLAGPYFPLTRFGEYTVAIRSEGGDLQSFSRFERPADAKWFAKQARATWPNMKVTEGVISNKDQVRGAVDAGFIADVEEILAGASAPDSLRDEIWQRYLSTLPDFSMRKRFIHRKGTPGYQEDAIRAFGSAMFHGSHQLARLKYGPQLTAKVNEIRQQAAKSDDPVDAGILANEFERRHKWVMDPKGAAWAQAISSGAFVWNLAVSPAAALVNLTQTYMLGVPILGARLGGITRATTELSKAATQLLGSKGLQLENSLKGDERRAMDEFYRLGLVDRTQSHNLAGVGETGVEYSSTRAKWMGRLSFMFHHAERVNREITALAAYRMAKRQGQGHDAAVRTASDMTWLTHFDYSNSSRARYMQHDVAKVLAIHKQHSINMTYRLFRDIHQALKGATAEDRRIARTQFVGVMGMHALMAGAKGLPFYGVAMMAAGLLKDAFGDDDDERTPEDLVKRWLYESGLPKPLADSLLYGAPSTATGLSLYNRIGFPDFFFRSPNKELEGKAEAEYWISQILGAGFAIPVQVWTGVNMMRKGDFGRGVENMLPKFARDVVKAGRYGKEGALTFTGDPIIDEINAWQMIGQAAGFSPFELSKAYDERNAKTNLQTAINNRRARLMNRYALSWKNDDKDGMDELITEFEQFNKAYPEKAITPDGIRSSIRAREARSQRNNGGAVLDRKLEDRIERDLGLGQ